MLTLALLAVLGAPAPIAPADTVLAVRTVRFYRAEAGQTQVAAFIETGGPEGGSLQVQVRDAAGTTLWEQQWPRVAAASTATEHLRFTIGPGTHRLEVTLHDSAGSLLARAASPVEGFGPPPGASDLLLSPRIRPAALAEGMPDPDEFRRGDLLITAAVHPQVTDDLHYLLEAYNGNGGPGTLTLLVQDAAGATVREAPPASIRVPAGVAVLSGTLDLSPLPPGHYRLVLHLVADGRLLERSAGFERREK
jgi:hypothetical protein